MKISQKGLYALQALMMLARNRRQGTVRIRDIAYEENLPEKFLEMILLELRNAHIVESIRGAKGGYELRREPADLRLGEVIRLIDGPLAPFGDANHMRQLIRRDDVNHWGLYQVFLKLRDAAAQILDNTTLADLMAKDALSGGNSYLPVRKAEKQSPDILPIAAGGRRND